MGILALGFFIAMLVGYGVLYRRIKRRRVGVASVGMLSDMLNQDRRKAVEIVVTEKAGARDAETDDDLPPENQKGRPA